LSKIVFTLFKSKLDEKEVKVSLTKMEYHSAFSWNSFKNDICVLTLDRDVTNYLPDGNNFPCLPPINHSWKTNTVCYAAGWGLTKEWGSIATELQSVDIWTFDDEQCAKQQDHHAKEMICAGKIGGIYYILLEFCKGIDSSNFVKICFSD
jgi:hypothetical protein